MSGWGWKCSWGVLKGSFETVNVDENLEAVERRLREKHWDHVEEEQRESW